ncbi:FAD-dependent oxidoreductase, partial [Victivallis vadensis]
MFESLDLPVLFEAEVVVAGGGPAGIAAALAAARLGKRVVLLEQTGSLGGMGTNALVPAVIYQSDGVNWVVGDFCRSIIEECCREMGIDEVNPGWQEVDAEILKRIYDDRLLKAGVKLFYMIRVADVVVRSGKLESLLVATPHGLRKVKGEVFVDATGDAAVAAFAGV